MRQLPCTIFIIIIRALRAAHHRLVSLMCTARFNDAITTRVPIICGGRAIIVRIKTIRNVLRRYFSRRTAKIVFIFSTRCINNSHRVLFYRIDNDLNYISIIKHLTISFFDRRMRFHLINLFRRKRYNIYIYIIFRIRTALRLPRRDDIYIFIRTTWAQDSRPSPPSPRRV